MEVQHLILALFIANRVPLTPFAIVLFLGGVKGIFGMVFGPCWVARGCIACLWFSCCALS